MRIKIQEKSNFNASQAKNIGSSQKAGEKNRICPREILKGQYCRKIIIPLSSTTVHILNQNTSRLEHLEEEQIKISKQYDLQSLAKSQHIIKNLSLKIQLKRIIFVQEDYDCFLSEFPISQLSFEKRLNLFYCIVKGVRDLHNLNICHRSLNPFHVCIIKRGEDILAKINYFEKAIQLSNKKQTLSDKAAGTNFLNREYDHYSSPEMRERENHGLSTDIWSLGSLLSYILYGTVNNIWEEKQQVKIEVPEGTPMWLFQLLKMMLHYDPSRRHTINTVIDIIKVSLKCVQVMEKYIPLGSKGLSLNKTERKIE